MLNKTATKKNHKNKNRQTLEPLARWKGITHFKGEEDCGYSGQTSKTSEAC